jgi:Flp pilus assembly protein TadG
MKTRLKLQSVGLMLFVLVGFLALAVDAGYVWVAQNELQNAADAGALAGARFLINQDGTINTGSNQIAHDAATSNDSTNIPVEVNWSGGNSGDVQRGHWSMATRTFTPNANTTQTDLWQGEAALDADVNYINAVRVVTRRQNQPVNLFIAGILGHDSMQVVTDAVAWIGPPGDTEADDFDMPLALCAEALEAGCTIGRLITSDRNHEGHYQTGGWTDFDSPCSGGGTNAPEVTARVNEGCSDAGIQLNSPLLEGATIETQGGMIQSAFTAMRNCWIGATGRTKPWILRLPVLFCGDEANVNPCEILSGAVTVEVLWITGPGEDPDYIDAPTAMDGWVNNNPDGSVRWNDADNGFVTAFELKNLDGSPAPYKKKTVYFKPSCNTYESIGGSGGGYYGMMAARPVLVE